jgi:hypothetical protein
VDTIFGIGRECADVQYRKVQIMVRSGFGDRALSLLRSIALSRREFYMAALMDPEFTPVHGLVEDTLAALLDTSKTNAKEKLALAWSACKDLAEWFDSDEERVKNNLETAARLDQLLKKGSYYGILEVAERSKAIIFDCQSLREQKLDELEAMIAEKQALWQSYQVFWAAYTYQPLFSSFGGLLGGIYKDIERCRALLADNSGQSYRQALEAVEQVARELRIIKPQISRMVMLKSAVDLLRTFGKRLVLVEIGVVVLALIVLPVIVKISPDAIPSGLTCWMGDPVLQRKYGLFALGIVAPMLALVVTLWDVRRL